MAIQKLNLNNPVHNSFQKSLGLDSEVSKEDQYFEQRMARVSAFFDGLIIVNELDEDSIQRACWKLGMKHTELLENSDFHIAYWTVIKVSMGN